MDCMVHGVAKSQTWLNNFHFHFVASQVAPLVKNLPANARDARDSGLIPGSGKSSGGWTGKLLQYSCLENPMDRGAWQATVHRITKNQTRLKWFNTYQYSCLGNSMDRGYWQATVLGIQRVGHSQRIKILGQSENNAQLWMWLVMEARSNAVKNNIA